MPGHLSERELDSYYRRRLPVEEMLAADEHLAACQACYERFGGPEKLEELYWFARTDLNEAEGSESECLPIEKLGRFVNREPLGVEDRDRIEGHLASCEGCAQLVVDLRRIRSDIDWDNPIEPLRAAPDLTPPQRFWTPARIMGVAAAAAILIAALTAVAVVQREFSQLRARITELEKAGVALERDAAGSRDLRDEVARLHLEIDSLRAGSLRREEVALTDGGRQITLDPQGNVSGLDSVPLTYVSLVKEALTDERVRIVDPSFPGQGGAHIRGSGRDETFRLRFPVGVAVLSERPSFKWEPLEGAERYVVFVRDLTSDVEIESPATSATEWTPEAPLMRGHAYAWAVEALKEGQRIHAPAAQGADARFKILEKTKGDELSRAKSSSGGSHLVMGVIYARYGLVSEAEAELVKLRAENPKNQLVARLVKSLRPKRR